MSGEKSLYEQKTGGKQMKLIKNLYKWCEEHITITIVMLSFIIITLCSKNSFLYCFNDGQDYNTCRTVGRGIINGIVPYKDLYEQKGPYVYFLFALDNIIPMAAYTIEILACGITLFFAYKMVKNYSKTPLINVIVFGIIAYFSESFSHGGGTVEEYFMPIMIYVIYIGLEYTKGNKSALTYKQFLLIGIYSGMILWAKYSLLGFFIGWCIVPFGIMIKNKEWKKIKTGIGCIVIGVIAVTIPVFIYFGYNQAIKDLIQVYFVDNIGMYTVKDNIIINVIVGVIIDSIVSKFVMIGVILGLINIFKLTKLEKAYFLIIFAVMLLTIYGGGTFYRYYYFPFTFYILFMVTSHKLTKVIAVILIGLSILLNSNIRHMQYEKMDMPQYKFAEIICKEKNPTVLNYNFLDGGFYAAAEVVPNIKYFCHLNIGIGSKEMEQHIKNKKVDFYICRDKQIQFDGYTEVSSASFQYEEQYRTYYLYQLVEE